MAISVTAQNTKLYKAADGWVKVVYDTGNRNADGTAITYECHLTKAAIEVSAGVLLPKARIKAIVTEQLNKFAPVSGQEITAL